MQVKFAHVLLVPLFLGLLALPTSADNDTVPRATLNSLGLEKMQIISDTAAMEVRGKSSAAQGASFSMFSAALFDPFSGSNFTSSAANFSQATDENAGFNSASSVSVSSAAVNAAFPATITTGASTWTANIGAITASGAGLAISP